MSAEDFADDIAGLLLLMPLLMIGACITNGAVDAHDEAIASRTFTQITNYISSGMSIADREKLQEVWKNLTADSKKSANYLLQHDWKLAMKPWPNPNVHFIMEGKTLAINTNAPFCYNRESSCTNRIDPFAVISAFSQQDRLMNQGKTSPQPRCYSQKDARGTYYAVAVPAPC